MFLRRILQFSDNRRNKAKTFVTPLDIEPDRVCYCVFRQSNRALDSAGMVSIETQKPNIDCIGSSFIMKNHYRFLTRKLSPGKKLNLNGPAFCQLLISSAVKLFTV